MAERRPDSLDRSRRAEAWRLLLAACSLLACCTSDDCPEGTTSRSEPGSVLRICCADGLVACNGACVPSTSTCGCPVGAVRCGGSSDCVDRLTNLAHCGACGRACAAGEACLDGHCGCPPGRARCGASCVDTLHDGQHCGACGSPCATDQACRWGRCVTACPESLGACRLGAPGACDVDLVRSREHCGACFQACPPNFDCHSGVCTCAETSACARRTSEPVLGAECTSLNFDRVCPRELGTSPYCSEGRCAYTCEHDFGRCGRPTSPGCETPLNTVTDCGACGLRCAPGLQCFSGACACPPGQTSCASRCVALRDSAAHCGACGAACSTGEDCASGRCAPRARPRLLWPPSAGVLGTRRPTFRWLPVRGEAAVRLELCRDRACKTPVTTLMGATASLTLPVDLPAGVLFWRVRSATADGAEATSATWELRLTTRTGVGGGLLGHFVDVNGDGFADHVRRRDSNVVCAYLGDAGGLRRGACRDYGDAASGFDGSPPALGDFDGDGFTDVAVRDNVSGPGLVLVLRGGPSGLGPPERFWDDDGPWPLPSPTTPGSYGMGGVGDVDGDGYADLAVQTTLVARQLALHGGGAGTPWIPRRILPGLRVPLTRYLAEAPNLLVNVGDLNGDGHGDLAVDLAGETSPRPVWVLHGGAEGPLGDVSWSLPARAETVQGLIAGDFDGDGLGDIGFADATALRVYRGRVAGLPRTPDQTESMVVRDVARATSFDGARDLDGDGRSDVVVTAYGPRLLVLRVLVGGAEGLTATARVSNIGGYTSGPRPEWVADVDRDGFDDVVVAENSGLLFYRGGPDGLPENPSQRVPPAIGP